MVTVVLASVGEHARRVQGRLGDGLASAVRNREWHVEHTIAGTPVDIAGVGLGVDTDLVVVELEWRREDTATNVETLFRQLATGTITADRVTVMHLFSRYD